MAWEYAFSLQMLDLALSEEDVEELRSERSIKQTLVSPEEIEELTVDENLSPLDRLIYVFRNGKDVQKVHGISNMYNIIEKESRENIEKILLLFKEVLSNTLKDIQLSAAKLLVQLSENRLINGEKLASHFFQYLLTSVKNEDTEICEAWVHALIASLNLLPKRYLSEVVEFLKSCGTLSQPMHIRLLCCKLISHVSKHVDRKKLTSVMIPIMRSLCQDIDLDVRACMCSELDVMLSYIGNDVMKEFLLPELFLLLQDEEASVRTAGLETVAKIVSAINPDLIQMSPLRKLIVKFYTKAIKKKIIPELIGSARFIGQILCSPSGLLDDEQKLSMLQCYKILCIQGIAETQFKQDGNIHRVTSSCSDKSAECRYWCAYNFPAVLISATTDQAKSIILPSFLSLTKDVHPAVRKTLACSFHEISKLLATDIDIINDSLVTFLNEKDVEILAGVMSGLPITLGLMFNSSSQQNYVTDLLPTLLECEKYISNSLRWRVHEKFIKNMSCLGEFLTSDELYMKLVPLLFNILGGNKVQPVKLAAGYTLLSFIKVNHNIDERNEMCIHLEAELAHSKSKTSRILFLDLCHYVSILFSRSFFKEMFYNAAVELAIDPVANVRIKFCETLPLLKSQIRLPCDRLLLQSLEQTVRRIMAMDNDRDVSNAIRQAITEMDSIRLSMDGTPPTEEDLIDREKEEEEETLLEEFTLRKQEDNKQAPRERLRSQSCHEKVEHSKRLSSDSNEKQLSAKASQQKGTRSGTKLIVAKKSNIKPPKETHSNKISARTNSGQKLQVKRYSMPSDKDKRH